MANPTQVAGSAVGSSSSTSISKPTTAGYTEQSGDLILIMCVSGNGNDTGFPTPPTGFSVIAQRNDDSSFNRQAVTWAYKYDSGSEPWPKSFIGNLSYNVWACAIVRNPPASAPLDGNTNSNGGNLASGSDTITLAALTASNAGGLLVIMVADVNDVNVATWPSGVSEYAAASNPTGNGVMVGLKSLTAAGSTGSLSTTLGGSAGTKQACAFIITGPAAGGTPSAVGALTSDGLESATPTLSGSGADVGGLSSGGTASGLAPLGAESGGLNNTGLSNSAVGGLSGGLNNTGLSNSAVGGLSGGLDGPVVASGVGGETGGLAGRGASISAIGGEAGGLGNGNGPPSAMGGLGGGLSNTGRSNSAVGGLSGGLSNTGLSDSAVGAESGGLAGGVQLAQAGPIVYHFPHVHTGHSAGGSPTQQ